MKASHSQAEIHFSQISTIIITLFTVFDVVGSV